MRKQLKLWAAAAAVLVGAPFVSADLILSTTRSQITAGANAGADQVRFFILNNGANGTGTKLIGVASQMTTDDHFIFRFANLDADTTPDADIQMSETTSIPFHNSDGSDPTIRTTSAYSINPNSSNNGTAIRPVGGGIATGTRRSSFPILQEAIQPSQRIPVMVAL